MNVKLSNLSDLIKLVFNQDKPSKLQETEPEVDGKPDASSVCEPEDQPSGAEVEIEEVSFEYGLTGITIGRIRMSEGVFLAVFTITSVLYAAHSGIDLASQVLIILLAAFFLWHSLKLPA